MVEQVSGTAGLLGPKPGWKTTEWISTITVHALSAVAIVLDLVRADWTHGLSAIEVATPIVALVVSALLQAVYSNHRTSLKSAYLAELARVAVAQIEHDVLTTSVGPVLGDIAAPPGVE